MSDRPIVHGLSHVDVPVRSLARALAVYHGVLGFEVKTRGEGHVDLDAGGVLLRLFETAHPEHRTSLRILSDTVERTLEALVATGCTPMLEASRTPSLEWLGAVRDPDGHVVYVHRPLTEDEYGFAPELPKELAWDPDAEALLKSLLGRVPFLFRALARGRVVRVAEELAEGTRLVGREEVIRAYILATPKVNRARTRQPLLDHGVDLAAYAADWDAD